eukprot:2429469-Pyramimonas_sp.AAC.1
MGGWNLTPGQISRPIRDGVGGYVVAPGSPTCVAELPGSIIDVGLACVNLSTRLRTPKVMESSTVKVHKPVVSQVRANDMECWRRVVREPVPFPKVPPIGCLCFPLDWDELEKAIYFAEHEADISAAWDIMMTNIELELQGVCGMCEGPEAVATSGRAGPVENRLARSKWVPPRRRLQHGEKLRAYMMAHRWSQLFLCMQRFRSKAVAQILIWEDKERVVNFQADLLPLARFLGEA